MGTTDILSLYDNIRGDMKFITTSSVRTNIILSLNKGNKDLNELKKELNIESSAALHALKKLETHDIVIKNGSEYVLSSFGKLYAIKSEKLFKSFYVINSCEKIWLDHWIDGIPKKLLREIGCLNNSFLVESTPTDIIRPHSHYARLIANAHEIKCVLPIFYYPYIDLFKNALKRNAYLEFILTPLILDKTIETAGVELLNDSLSSKNLKLYKIDEDVKVALTVAENFLSIGLFSVEGLYDATMNLISYDADAIEWGNKLFNYYLNRAKKLNLDHFDK